jgi:hypothetical protein
MTKIIIDTVSFPSNMPSSTSNEENIESKILTEWSGCFQVDFTDIPTLNNCNNLSRCSRLTTLELKRNFIKETKPDSIKNIHKYLVAIESVRSPMQTLKVKDSNTPSLRKFLKSIDTSYKEEYYTKNDTNIVYALLNVSQDTLNDLNNNKYANSNVKVFMSSFLRHHLKLFEINPKIMIKAESIKTPKCEAILSRTTKQNIKLITDYKKNV